MEWILNHWLEISATLGGIGELLSFNKNGKVKGIVQLILAVGGAIVGTLKKPVKE